MEVVLSSVDGAVRIAVALLTRPLRKRRITWGATPAEVASTYPGDDLVPRPDWGYTHAVDVAAPPGDVWPWLVQLGQGRGGFYSYQGLENLIGCHITNTTRIVEEYQHLAVGDDIRLHPKAPGLRVRIVEPGRSLVLLGGADDSPEATLWAFHLVDAGAGRSRLIERGRYAHGAGLGSRVGFGPTLLEPISFVMSRKMLLTIAELAGGAQTELPTYRVTWWRSVVNTMMRVLLARGAAPPKMALLETTGNRSGRARTTPVYVTSHGGQRFLVAPYGAVGWVRNARADPQVRLHRGARSETLTATEVDAETGAPVLAQYHRTVKVTRPYFRAEPGAEPAELLAEAELHPVFRLD